MNEKKEFLHENDKISFQPNQVKIALVGTVNCGKREMRHTFIEGFYGFSCDYNPQFSQRTVKRITINGRTVDVDVLNVGNKLPDNSINDNDKLQSSCENAHMVIFVFDLSNYQSLKDLGRYFQNVYTINKKTHYLVVGNKFDLYQQLPEQEHEKITVDAIKFTEYIGSDGLIYISSRSDNSVNKVFNLAVGSILGFTLKKIPRKHHNFRFVHNCKNKIAE